MPSSDEEFKEFLTKIQKQYLCCYPLHCIEWQNFPADITWNQQKDLIDSTYNTDINQRLPIKLAYQLNFLKKLIAHLEQQCPDEVHDAIYESFCRVQQNIAKDSTNKYAFKHYILNAEVHFTLRESKSFVAEGTTGLCSWQASLALADFILHHKELVENKAILELGAGTGLCSLIIFKMCNPFHVVASDGSPQCVDLMAESVKRNFPYIKENEKNKFSLNSRTLECSVIPWEVIHDIQEVRELKPELILAADVVYDDSCFEDLSYAIDYVFKLRDNQMEMFLAATVRNEHTLNGFLKKLDALQFVVTEEPTVPLDESLLYWDRTTPVKILKIIR